MGANYYLYVQVSYVALDSFDFYDECLTAAFYQMGTSVQVSYLALENNLTLNTRFNYIRINPLSREHSLHIVYMQYIDLQLI